LLPYLTQFVATFLLNPCYPLAATLPTAATCLQQFRQKVAANQ